MPINVDYSPVPYLVGLSRKAGLGEYQRRNQALQLQYDQMAQQDAAQQRAIGANLLSQELARRARQGEMAADNNFRAQMADRQAALQKQMDERNFQQQLDFATHQNDLGMKRAQFEREAMSRDRHLAGQYGLYNDAMDGIYKLEQKGAQYTEAQSKQLAELEAARNAAQASDELDDDGKRQAEMQYWQKRSRIVPTQPPPPSLDELMQDSVRAVVTRPDGTTAAVPLHEVGDAQPSGYVLFNKTKGEFSFRPAPAPKQDNAAALEQKAKEKQEADQAKRQVAMWNDYRKMIGTINGMKADTNQDGRVDEKDEKIQQQNADALRRAFRHQYGDVMPEELYAEFGLAPPGGAPRGDATAELLKAYPQLAPFGVQSPASAIQPPSAPDSPTQQAFDQAGQQVGQGIAAAASLVPNLAAAAGQAAGRGPAPEAGQNPDTVAAELGLTAMELDRQEKWFFDMYGGAPPEGGPDRVIWDAIQREKQRRKGTTHAPGRSTAPRGP